MEDNINRKLEDIAYLAGFVDADGTIGLYYYKKHHEYLPFLAITASRRDILEELQVMFNFGGSVSTIKNSKTSKRSVSRLTYMSTKACKVCEMVQPYLRLKGAQAVIITQIGYFRKKYYKRIMFNYDAYYVPRYEEMRRLNEANKSPKIR